MTRKENILAAVQEQALDFLFYDRDDDSTLRPGDVQEAVTAGELTKEEIVKAFADALDRDW